MFSIQLTHADSQRIGIDVHFSFQGQQRGKVFYMKSKRKRGKYQKERKYLTWQRKWDLIKGKPKKYLPEGKKHSDMEISNRFDTPIFAMRKWLLFLKVLPRSSWSCLAPLLFLEVRLVVCLRRARSLWGGRGLSYKLWSGRHSGSRWEADKERTTDQHLKPYWEI